MAPAARSGFPLPGSGLPLGCGLSPRSGLPPLGLGSHWVCRWYRKGTGLRSLRVSGSQDVLLPTFALILTQLWNNSPFPQSFFPTLQIKFERSSRQDLHVTIISAKAGGREETPHQSHT